MAGKLSYFEQAGLDDIFSAYYERALGGSTWHWNGTCLRFLASDFRLRSLYGHGSDWPIEASDLNSFYEEAEAALGVAGSKLLPELPPTLLDKAVAQVCPSLGLEVQVLPAARNSVPYQGRPACEGNATCFPICTIGAKYDATVHLQFAKEKGAQILNVSQVRRLKYAENRILHAELVDGQTLQADHFVLACNAIETPRLLLASGFTSYALGRYLMGMARQVSWALAPQPVWPHRSPHIVSGILNYRDGAHRRERAASMTFIGNNGWPAHSPNELARKFNRQGLRGQNLGYAVRDHLSRQMLLVTNCEELPLIGNRVQLSRSCDPNGMQRPKLDFELSQYTHESIEHSVLLHTKIFKALGASSVNHVKSGNDPAYVAGTVRMGKTARTSCVDGNLKYHDVHNLHVVGSAVFPTCGSAPPTLTIAALSLRLRLAHHLARRKSQS